MKTTVTEGEISLDGRILVKQKALAPFRTCWNPVSSVTNFISNQRDS
jgi:hypothetical protein